MIANVLCTGVLIVASLFSVVKNYLANPPPEPQTPIVVVEEVEKGTKVCRGHAFGFSLHGKGSFEYAKEKKERYDERLPYDDSLRNFDTKIYMDKEKDWVCQLSYVHVDNCSDCDEYDLIEEESQISLDADNEMRVCQGHSDLIKAGKGNSQSLFSSLKKMREEWDERTSYDRSIQEYNSELYKENGEWFLHYQWTHVNGCAQCNNYILSEENFSVNFSSDRQGREE